MSVLDQYTRPFNLPELQQEFKVRPVDYGLRREAPKYQLSLSLNRKRDRSIEDEQWWIEGLVQRYWKEYNTDISILGRRRVGKSSLFLRTAEMFEMAMKRPICDCKPTVKFLKCQSTIRETVPTGPTRQITIRRPCPFVTDDEDLARNHAIEHRHTVASPQLMPWLEKPCPRVVEWVRLHVYYKSELFFKEIPNLPLGAIIGFDEGGVTYDAHSWQERRSRLFRKLAQMWGKFRFVVVYIAPDAAFENRSVKLNLDTYVIVYQRQYARVYGLKKDYLGGVDTRWRDSEGRPRELEGWPFPQTPGLWPEYNRVKDLNIADFTLNTLATEGQEIPNQEGWMKAMLRPEEEMVYPK